jgi:hypothetical protein
VEHKKTTWIENRASVQHKKTTWIDKTAPVQHRKTTWIDETAPMQHKKTTWIDKIAPVQHKTTIFMLHWCCIFYPDCLFYVALVLFCLSRLSLLCCTCAVLSIQVVFLCCTGAVLSIQVVFLCCTGAILSIHVVFLCCTGGVLSIQVVFFMLYWCCFVYPGCNVHAALVLFNQNKKTTWKDKTAQEQHKKDNPNRQNSTSATKKRQPG